MIDWIFGGKSVICSGRFCSIPSPHDRGYDVVKESAHHLGLCKLHVLAEKLGVEELADEAVEMFAMKCHGGMDDRYCRSSSETAVFYSPETITYIYTYTSQDSRLRLVVQEKALDYFLGDDHDDMTSWVNALISSPDFAREVSNALKLRVLERG